MEALVILLFIILIVLILTFRGSALSRIEDLEGEIRRLRQDLERNKFTAGGPAPAGRPAAAEQPVTQPLRTPPAAPDLTDPPVPRETEPFIPRVAAITGTVPDANMGTHRAAGAAISPAAVETPGFFERHPDLEKFIGENLVSKIGIAILVLAIGFFVKYAIDNDWIGPAGRVGVGLLCGGILIGLAHFMRNSYKAFSSVLVGGGLAIFYFTITLAYHQYGLFSQTAAFVIMLVITIFAVILSLLYDRQELAIIALAGGFLAPFLASNGSGHYQTLFGYLMILNTGLLVIAYNKAWRLLNILAFGFTAILFASWLITLPYETPPSTYQGGFLFATAFYILFFIINIAHNIRENRRFIASDFGILLSNTCLYFAAGLYLIAAMGMRQYQGLFSASMGVFNLVTSYLLFRKKKVDSNILYLLIGITLSFISLTAPLQLHGHTITLFWGSEAVLLYWLYSKSAIHIIRMASTLIWLAMVISLLMDWSGVYLVVYDRPGAHFLPVIFNKGFMTGLYASLCCFALFFLCRNRERYKLLPLVTGGLLLFITGILEINQQFESHYAGSDLSVLYLLLYTFSFISLFTWVSDRLPWTISWWHTGILLAACILIYLVFISEIFEIQQDMLEGHHYGGHFWAHWISAFLVATILRRLIARQRAGRPAVDPVPFTWAFTSLVVIFLSAEILLMMEALFYSKSYPAETIQQVYYKTGLPILWGLCSFAFMWLGMKFKFKPLRIISLVLFSITLLKLFLFDIRNIPVAGKIAAFFCLGVLLLVVSFMYQRLKKIIIEDEEKKNI